MIEATSASPGDRLLTAQNLMLPGFIFLEAQNPSPDHNEGSDSTGFCDCLLNGCEVETANCSSFGAGPESTIQRLRSDPQRLNNGQPRMN